MKKVLIMVIALSFIPLISFSEEKQGEKLFKSKGCAACHKPDKKVVGPSLKRIANTYEGNIDSILKFMQGKTKPIVEPERFNLMKPSLEKLKKMKKEELTALARYILKFFEGRM